ncbi:MAG: YggS family pyridoxal phosphate-dependent enzyme [Acinetobacter sp.]|mgnify:CR=1 FL=1|jgi:pyridoxal phosphate enzyme (YggS family)|nr:MAG: YggS family pyridoxal phosphate-dependent enzyme [Acinetobacter sp.]
MSNFASQYAQVLQQIEHACQKVERDCTAVQLLAVSKNHPASHITALYELGQRTFGENYLQEALDKIAILEDLAIEWHFIGHVQRNKTKHLAEKFDWVHGVDRLVIAERLSRQRPVDLASLNICLQVNIDEQESKDGCQPHEVVNLVTQMSQLPNIHLRGLMVIPAPNNVAAFADAQALFEQVKVHHAHPQNWDTLSMGMSGDVEAAIAAGSTIVRIGTALFGERHYR